MRVVCSEFDVMTFQGWKNVFETSVSPHKFDWWQPRKNPICDVMDEIAPHLVIIAQDEITSSTLACFEEFSRTVFLVYNPKGEELPSFKNVFGFDYSEESLPQACDVIGMLNATSWGTLAGEVLYVGQYEKGLEAPLYKLSERRRLRVVGESGWRIPQYVGQIHYETLKDLLKSHLYTLQASSHYDWLAYNATYMHSLCFIREPYGVIGLDLPSFTEDNLEDQLEKYSNVIKREECVRYNREAILQSHTCWHRVERALLMAGFENEANTIRENRERFICS